MAGKPAPTLMADALSRGDFHAPLVVGDRLDTDIAGAYAADLPSLMVLSGVNSARDVVGATVEQRPTFLAHDLRALHTDPATAAVTAQPAWRTDVDGARITVSANGADPGAGRTVRRAGDGPGGMGHRNVGRHGGRRRRHGPCRAATLVAPELA